MRSWWRLAVPVPLSVGVAVLLGVPTPALFGGMVGSASIALRHERVPRLSRPLAVSAQFVIGAAVGARLDRASVEAVGAEWPAIAGCVLATIAISIVCGQLFRIVGVTPVTGAFAAVAGGASGVIAMADALGADERVVAVFQYLRVVMIVATLPLVVRAAGAPGAAPALPTAVASPALVGATYLVAVIAGAWLARALPFGQTVPGVLVGLGLAPALGLAPLWRHAALPPAAIGLAFLALGVDVGLKFTRDSLRQAMRLLPLGLMSIGLVITACGGIGLGLAHVVGVDWVDGYLATTPGGLPAVIATASQTAGDVTFVVAVQVLRIIVVMLLAPVVLACTRR